MLRCDRHIVKIEVVVRFFKLVNVLVLRDAIFRDRTTCVFHMTCVTSLTAENLLEMVDKFQYDAVLYSIACS